VTSTHEPQALHWADLTFRPWRRHGQDRLYVNGANGQRLACLDNQTGALHVEDERQRPDLERVLTHHLAAARSHPVPVRPPTRRQVERKHAWQQGFARAARCNGTLSEHALWAELERSSPVRWKREVVDGDYRLDFYSRQARVAVEVDGSSHRGRARHDAARDAEFAARGIITVRVSAREVERDVGAVVARVNRECLARTGPVATRGAVPSALFARLRAALRGRRIARTPAADPAQPYIREWLGEWFVCAGCRQTCPPVARSRAAVGRCQVCVPDPMTG